MNKKLYICVENVPKEMFSSLPDKSCEGYLYELSSIDKIGCIHLTPIYPDNKVGDVWIDKELIDKYFKDLSKMIMIETEQRSFNCICCPFHTSYPNEDGEIINGIEFEYLSYCDIDGHCCYEEDETCPIYWLAESSDNNT